jgi:hypothetical protein
MPKIVIMRWSGERREKRVGALGHAAKHQPRSALEIIMRGASRGVRGCVWWVSWREGGERVERARREDQVNVAGVARYSLGMCA